MVTNMITVVDQLLKATCFHQRTVQQNPANGFISSAKLERCCVRSERAKGNKEIREHLKFVLLHKTTFNYNFNFWEFSFNKKSKCACQIPVLRGGSCFFFFFKIQWSKQIKYNKIGRAELLSFMHPQTRVLSLDFTIQSIFLYVRKITVVSCSASNLK